MNTKVFLPAIIAIVAAAVVGGLLKVGGPFQARNEKADDRRWDELVNLIVGLECAGNLERLDSSLPTELTVEKLSAHCSHHEFTVEDALTDDENGQQYVYGSQDDGYFFVCAKFHDPSRIWRLNQDHYLGKSFNVEAGCLWGVTP